MEKKQRMWRKCLAAFMVLVMCVCITGEQSAQAASKPARPSISLVKRTKTTAKIKIKKKGSVTGYQIAVKTSKKGKYKLVMPTRKSTFVLKKLKANKVYYVKVRAFKTRGYHIKHGKFSKPIKIGKYKKKSTKKPTATATPTPTQDVVTPSETPVPTQDPTVTESPEPTQDPTATESPAPTQDPAATDTPAPTQAPV
ncbi:MAG: fibronectin type III domain-containing protein [Lachnospiraceae bacterium]|nr:fibronectin type III domain-containing protein [Lachnospiraceae bacterium]